MLRHILIFIFAAAITSSAIGQGFVPLQDSIGLNHLFHPIANIGGGAIILDVNNDGFKDVYLTGGINPDQLLLNNNGESYTDISQEAGINIINNYYTMGGVSGDFNRDGYEDIFLTTWRFVETWGAPVAPVVNLMLLNNGDNTFSNVGGIAGILHPAFSASATLLDIDHDGYLDIYVANYMETHGFIYSETDGSVIGFAHECAENQLYINQAGQTFINQAETYGVNDSGCGLAAIATDYNADGHTDLMVINDFGEWVIPNALFKASESGFENVAEATGADIGLYGMGVAIGDYDEDGDFDYYITNMGNNALLKQESGGVFTEVAEGAGVLNGSHGDKLTTGWGTAFFDYDNDSYLDLYVSNGFMPSAPFIANAFYDPNKLYQNNQDGTFTDIAPMVGLRDTAVSHGAAIVDFNNDGLLDILQVNTYHQLSEAPTGAVLYLNQTQNDNHFVGFELRGVTANPHGIGARVELYAGGRMLIREVDGGSSHASHSDKRVHFGLGQMSQIDTVLIYWPGNPYPQVIADPQVDEYHIIEQDQVVVGVNQSILSLASLYPNPSSGTLFLHLPQATKSNLTILLSDVSGKVLADYQITESTRVKHNLSTLTAELRAGIYFVSVSDGTEQQTFRFVLQP